MDTERQVLGSRHERLVSGLILVLGVFAIKRLLLYLMYRKKIFLKI